MIVNNLRSARESIGRAPKISRLCFSNGWRDFSSNDYFFNMSTHLTIITTVNLAPFTNHCRFQVSGRPEKSGSVPADSAVEGIGFRLVQTMRHLHIIGILCFVSPADNVLCTIHVVRSSSTRSPFYSL